MFVMLNVPQSNLYRTNELCQEKFLFNPSIGKHRTWDPTTAWSNQPFNNCTCLLIPLSRFECSVQVPIVQ